MHQRCVVFISLLKSVKVPEFARAGGVAIEDVTLSAGVPIVSLCVSYVVHVCVCSVSLCVSYVLCMCELYHHITIVCHCVCVSSAQYPFLY